MRNAVQRAQDDDREGYRVTQMAGSDHPPLSPHIRLSALLGVCTHPGCKTIVFGRGTCVQHDPTGLQLANTLREQAVGRARAISGR